MVKPVEPGALLQLLADLNRTKSTSSPPEPHIVPRNTMNGDGHSKQMDANSPSL